MVGDSSREGVPMKCCGEERTTPYCPMCGSEMMVAPAQGLLRHIRKSVQSQQKRITNARRSVAAGAYGAPNSADNTKFLERRRANLEKWLSWQRVLEELIEFAHKEG